MKFENIEEIFKRAAENGAEFKSKVKFWAFRKSVKQLKRGFAFYNFATLITTLLNKRA